MTFSSAVTKQTVFGDRRVAYGTYTQTVATDVGGDITTGLGVVEHFYIQRAGTAVTAAIATTINESFPLASGDVTIVTPQREPGLWMAIGY